MLDTVVDATCVPGTVLGLGYVLNIFDVDKPAPDALDVDGNELDVFAVLGIFDVVECLLGTLDVDRLVTVAEAVPVVTCADK